MRAASLSNDSEAKAWQTTRKPRQPAGDNRRVLGIVCSFFSKYKFKTITK